MKHRIIQKNTSLLSILMVALAGAFFVFIWMRPSQAIMFAPFVTVGGIVTDSASGDAIAGVSVRIRTGQFFDETVITGMDGKYEATTDMCGSAIFIDVLQDGYEPYHASFSTGCYQTIEHNIALVPEGESRNPVVIIPGIAGTELFHEGDEIWMNIGRMVIDVNDDFLKALEMDETGASAEQIVVGDIIRQKFPDFIIWSRLIDDLINTGYVENTDLFVFPYDWRHGNADTAALLAGAIDEILADTGASKVDIIAHSMGGLVTKEYIRTRGEDKIDQIIFMGTPHYGAPKSLKTLLFGDTFGVPAVLEPDTIRDITMNMPAVYELLPSLSYFSEYNAYMLDMADADLNNVKGALDFDGTSAFIGNMHLNTVLRDNAVSFHSLVDGWTPSADLLPRVHNILGCASPTIGRLIAGYHDGQDVKWQAWMMDGDETVPLKSAQGVVNGREYYIPEAKHSRLPDSATARQLVLDILNNNDPNLNDARFTDIRDGESNCSFHGYLASVHSPVLIGARDASDNFTGRNADGGIDTEIPGSDYFEMGDDKFLYIPEGTNVTMLYDGSADGMFSLDIEEVSGEGPLASAHFFDVPVSAALRGEMDFQNNPALSSLSLVLDHDGDGTVDDILSPDTALNGEDAQDLDPPNTTITLSGEEGNNGWYISDVTFSLTAEDERSGVHNTLYSLDGGETWETYEEPVIVFGDGEHGIVYYSMDKAGNMEPYKKETIRIDTTTPEFDVYYDSTINDILITSPGSDLSCANRKCAAVDQAGNTSDLWVIRSSKKSRKSATLLSISYNGGERQRLDQNVLHVNRQLKDETIKRLIQNAAADMHAVEALYAAKKDTTFLYDIHGRDIQHKRLSGMAILHLMTDKGKVLVEY